MTKKKIVADVDESLHRAVKMKAAREGTTITGVIKELLSKWIGGPPYIAKYDEDIGWSTIEENEQAEPIQAADPPTRP